MQLIVRFRPEHEIAYDNGLFRGTPPEVIELINRIFRDFPDAQIEPLFTGERDKVPAHMRGYYAINVADADRARALQRKLQDQTSVEAVYIKPPADLP